MVIFDWQLVRYETPHCMTWRTRDWDRMVPAPNPNFKSNFCGHAVSLSAAAMNAINRVHDAELSPKIAMRSVPEEKIPTPITPHFSGIAFPNGQPRHYEASAVDFKKAFRRYRQTIIWLSLALLVALLAGITAAIIGGYLAATKQHTIDRYRVSIDFRQRRDSDININAGSKPRPKICQITLARTTVSIAAQAQLPPAAYLPPSPHLPHHFQAKPHVRIQARFYLDRIAHRCIRRTSWSHNPRPQKTVIDSHFIVALTFQWMTSLSYMSSLSKTV